MILILEMNWTGTTHAPANGAMIEIVAQAFPDQTVRFLADASHLSELQRSALAAVPNLHCEPIVTTPLFRGRPAVVSWPRMLHEFRTVLRALRSVPAGEPCLILLISATATSPFAAAWAARVSRRKAVVQVGFHGNLHDATGWRSRDPLKRAFDTRSSVTARYPVPVRFLVLEQAILEALRQLMPAASSRTDLLPHPVNLAEASGVPQMRLTAPVRIGFVGLGTAAKGVDTFLAIAKRATARWPGQVEFVHVGCVGPDSDPATYTALVHTPVTRHLTRQEFRNRMAALHYVFLPFRRGYYDFSASGALLDAVTWHKPVITTRVPLTQQFFAEYGDIGVLCDDEAALEAAVETILAEQDGNRYARQQERLETVLEARGLSALAQRYRALVLAGFPGLFDTQAARSDATPA